jgi:hypothetical protein
MNLKTNNVVHLENISKLFQILANPLLLLIKHNAIESTKLLNNAVDVSMDGFWMHMIKNVIKPQLDVNQTPSMFLLMFVMTV